MTDNTTCVLFCLIEGDWISAIHLQWVTIWTTALMTLEGNIGWKKLGFRMAIVWACPVPMLIACNDCYNHVTPYRDNTQSCCHSHSHDLILPITWLFLHTSPSPYVPWPVPRPWYTVLHSCGALCQTCVPLMCIASCTELYLCLYLSCTFSTPILCPMLPPCYMFPSIWLMLTFPVTPWIVPILLQVLIRLVLVFKPLVFTHVP